MPEPAFSNKNTIMIGFVAAWATLLASCATAWIIAMLLQFRDSAGSELLLLGVLPPLALWGVLAAGLVLRWRPFVSGVLIGFGSMFAISLLLVAACFGLFAMQGF